MGAPREDYSGWQEVTSPARKLVAVTPNDANELTYWARALWIGGAGNVAVIAQDDTAAVTISGVPAGTLLPISAKKVMATNTTATLIVAII